MSVPESRFLYLHGFASGPQSAKGVAIAAHFAARGIAIERLNMRVPSFEHLRVSEMVTQVRYAIGGPRDRAVVFGSSLGGYTAARTAADDPRVCALVLLAPAFQLFERWQRRLGEDGWRAWEQTGWLEVDDHATKGRSRVDFGFVQDALQIEAVDRGWPDARVPTLIVHGRRDDVVDIEVSRTFAAGKRYVRLVEVDDGHDLVASLPLIMREAEKHLATFLNDV